MSRELRTMPAWKLPDVRDTPDARRSSVTLETRLVKRQLAGILLTCLATAAGAESREWVELTFDKYKGKLYAAYTEELKINPGFKGKVEIEFGVATNGKVTSCRLKKSEMPNPRFGDTLCARVREFQFPPRQAPTTIEKRIDFYPAA